MAEKKIGKSADGRNMHYSAGIILDCKGKYLLLDRMNEPFGFACPAGHIDIGESPQEAAVRELREETGVRVKDPLFIVSEEVPWNFCRNASVHYWYVFRTGVPSFVFNLDFREAKSGGWYSPEEIRGLELERVWAYWLKKLEVI